jgi:hypothetical protein
MIIDLNISHYRELLKSATEPSKRRVILSLLAEEEAKLARLFREEMSVGRPFAPSSMNDR